MQKTLYAGLDVHKVGKLIARLSGSFVTQSPNERDIQ